MSVRVPTYSLRAFGLFLTVAGLGVSAQTEPAVENPAALFELAQRYEKGVGCPRDIGKALVYYKKSAAEGEPAAMVALGDLYREGICVPQDLRYSGDMYRQSANKGFAPGMMRLGLALETSGRRPEGIGWFRKAAAHGYGPAMTHLGDILADVDWYHRAVAAKDPPAFARLSENVSSTEAVQLLKQGSELGDPVAQARYGQRIEQTDASAAAKLYRTAAEAGEPSAMSGYARFAEKGLAGVPQSDGEALLWYTKAAAAKDAEGLHWMARRAEAAGQREEAIRMYRLAVGRAHTGAMVRLARLTDDKKLMSAAAESGDPEALYLVAQDLKDDALMQRAAELGNPEALAATGQVEKAAARGHVPSMLHLQRWQDAANAGSPEGLYRYGLSLPDKAEGTRYVQRAADAGYPAAMRDLAARTASGEGIAKDTVAAKTWYGKAAQAGDAIAKYKLGEPKKVQEAAEAGYAPAMVKTAETTGDSKWLEKAAESNYAPALTKLGKVDEAAAAGDPEAKILLGDRTKKPREAYKLYLEAAGAGSLAAMRRLAECHINGRGTSVSPIDGVNWYRKAAQGGDAESLAILQKLGKTLY
ncbi:MAG: sel1 repeat family protein [Bryobacteraceae bacterium]|nr:sel1 repeat family protein [Bryobacteraceae bacterium]